MLMTVLHSVAGREKLEELSTVHGLEVELPGFGDFQFLESAFTPYRSSFVFTV